MAYDLTLQEDSIKKKVAEDFFKDYDTTPTLGKVDFTVALKDGGLFEPLYFMWAEAKKGNKADVNESFVQLIMTIGKDRKLREQLPPMFLGAFDAQRIAFIEYGSIMDIFSQNDFNWKVAPSDYTTKEFAQLYEKVKEELETNSCVFEYDRDGEEIKSFIKKNFTLGGSGKTAKIPVMKNNFVAIYRKWQNAVAPFININWKEVKNSNILDVDFYLADLISDDNITLLENPRVALNGGIYTVIGEKDKANLLPKWETGFKKDGQKAHTAFWNKYERPPKDEYRKDMVTRRDLLVSDDFRKRHGSYFTPKCWVRLSQEYLAKTLGENWQDEYYIWDCCAGTGNLLEGLKNKYRIWATTLGEGDVKAMKEYRDNLLESNIKEFDFLEGNFNDLPKELKDIINDPKERRKLIVYINPPYAEASSADTSSGSGNNKPGVATRNETYRKYKNSMGKASNELFAQFFMRVYKEISGCILAEFSTLKLLQGINFCRFRNEFKASLKDMFIVPAQTFDNVNGQFPIGFMIWDTSEKKVFEGTKAKVYDAKSSVICEKTVTPLNDKSINEWLGEYEDKSENSETVALMSIYGTDFQNSRRFNILSARQKRYCYKMTEKNIIPFCVYFTVRKAIPATWLNNRDQFFYPNPEWDKDKEFKNDCLAYAIFNNNVKSAEMDNHWIPFTEETVGAKKPFKCHFMSDYIDGKIAVSRKVGGLFDVIPSETAPTQRVSFSKEATEVMEAGKALWKYYHAQENADDQNASLYDIRLYFQGKYEDENGNLKMKKKVVCEDKKYIELDDALRGKIETLANKIQPKIYQYGFLKDKSEKS